MAHPQSLDISLSPSRAADKDFLHPFRSRGTLHLRRFQIINLHSDPLAAGLVHQLSRLFNRFGTVHLGTLRTRGSAVQYTVAPAAPSSTAMPRRTSRRTRDQRHFALQYLTHHPTLSRSRPPWN